MRDEIPINEIQLKEAISDNYGIRISKMKYVPIGEVAHSYMLVSENKMKYFLKIYSPSRIVNKNVDKRYASHKIAHSLYHQEGIDQVTFPLETKAGEYRLIFENRILVIWSFIEGKMATEKQRRTKMFIQGLAHLLGRIHKSTSNLKSESVSKFSFDLKFRKDLLVCLKEATDCTDSKDKNYNKLQKLIKQHMNVILESLVFIEELSRKLEQRDDIEYVLCHCDPIIHNIIINKEEKLHLVDWDGAELAPYEQDLWFYIFDDQYKLFFQEYRKNRKIGPIDEDIVIFLFYERTLADLTDWIHRILFEEVSQEQMRNDFKGLEEDSWPVLATIKESENLLRKRIHDLST